jgi:hypothetical protein
MLIPIYETRRSLKARDGTIVMDRREQRFHPVAGHCLVNNAGMDFLEATGEPVRWLDVPDEAQFVGEGELMELLIPHAQPITSTTWMSARLNAHAAIVAASHSKYGMSFGTLAELVAADTESSTDDHR